jgi:hypothetical protein
MYGFAGTLDGPDRAAGAPRRRRRDGPSSVPREFSAKQTEHRAAVKALDVLKAEIPCI